MERPVSRQFAVVPTTFLAVIAFVPTEAGGRKTPVSTDYRPQFYFQGEDFDCKVAIAAGEWISPGESATVEIILWTFASDATAGQLHCGTVFELHEGAKVVAGGVITGMKVG
jgi:elongation factor Tu